MITIDIIEEVWRNFDEFKERAEQHNFPKLLQLDISLSWYYKDLHKNWDEEHGLIFMRAMQKIAKYYGFECPEFEEGEIDGEAHKA